MDRDAQFHLVRCRGAPPAGGRREHRHHRAQASRGGPQNLECRTRPPRQKCARNRRCRHLPYPAGHRIGRRFRCGTCIRSMAATHELLSSRHWQELSLIELIRRELAPYDAHNNTEINGPTVLLKPEAGQAMAMVLHELATNADLIPYEFGGMLDLVFAPEGVRCRLELPPDWLTNPGESRAAIANTAR